MKEGRRSPPPPLRVMPSPHNLLPLSLSIKSASSSSNTKLTILKRNSRSPNAGDVVMEQGIASTEGEVMSEEERKNLEAAKEFQRTCTTEFYREKAALEKAALKSKKGRSDSEGESPS